jgi:membrane-associated phospholipid phosphatase
MKLFFPISFACLLSLTVKGHASDFGKFVSGPLSYGYLGYGLVKSRQVSPETFFRLGDSLLTSAAITEGLKRVTLVERPDGSSRSSFPSGHATVAFSVARFMQSQEPKDAAWWYAGALLIGWSRVDLNRHRWTDVLAGAAVGILTTDAELRSKNGLLLRPFWTPSTATVGLQVQLRF